MSLGRIDGGKIGRAGKACHVGVAGGVHCDAVGAVVAGAAQISNIVRIASGGIQLEDKSVPGMAAAGEIGLKRASGGKGLGRAELFGKCRPVI